MTENAAYSCNIAYKNKEHHFGTLLRSSEGETFKHCESVHASCPPKKAFDIYLMSWIAFLCYNLYSLYIQHDSPQPHPCMQTHTHTPRHTSTDKTSSPPAVTRMLSHYSITAIIFLVVLLHDHIISVIFHSAPDK